MLLKRTGAAGLLSLVTLLLVFLTRIDTSAAVLHQTYSASEGINNVSLTLSAEGATLGPNNEFRVSTDVPVTIGYQGFLSSGTAFSIFAYWLYQDAVWGYTSPYNYVRVYSGTYLAGSGFKWGTSITGTRTLSFSEAGSHRILFIFGNRSFAHNYPDAVIEAIVEVGSFTPPADPDSDGDGVTDARERFMGTDPANPASFPDMNADPDLDGLDNEGEFLNTTNPLRADTDGDCLTDGLEDANGDGILDPAETDPFDADTDDDGLIDGNCGSEDLNANGIFEPLLGETDPRNSDSDGDGITDGVERGLTAPESADTDLATGAFLADADPATTTDPTKADTDGDGIPDGAEDSNRNGRVDEGETDPNPRIVPAEVSVSPATLNCKSKGDRVHVFVELPSDYPLNAIDVTSLIFSTEAGTTAVIHPEKASAGDHDEDGIPDLKVQFERGRILKIVTPGDLVIAVEGRMLDGTWLRGETVIRVLSK